MSTVYENVDYDGLLAMIDRKSCVIDVREHLEVAATGSVPSSVNIPRNAVAYLHNTYK